MSCDAGILGGARVRPLTIAVCDWLGPGLASLLRDEAGAGSSRACCLRHTPGSVGRSGRRIAMKSKKHVLVTLIVAVLAAIVIFPMLPLEDTATASFAILTHPLYYLGR